MCISTIAIVLWRYDMTSEIGQISFSSDWSSEMDAFTTAEADFTVYRTSLQRIASTNQRVFRRSLKNRERKYPCRVQSLAAGNAKWSIVRWCLPKSREKMFLRFFNWESRKTDCSIGITDLRGQGKNDQKTLIPTVEFASLVNDDIRNVVRIFQNLWTLEIYQDHPHWGSNKQYIWTVLYLSSVQSKHFTRVNWITSFGYIKSSYSRHNS